MPEVGTYTVEQCAERVRTSSRQLLLHCNLLLDCDLGVQRAEGHLTELDGLVRTSNAVEVSFRWKLDAHDALKRALVALALRLELYARALVTQREGAGSLLNKASSALKGLPTLRSDAAAPASGRRSVRFRSSGTCS